VISDAKGLQTDINFNQILHKITIDIYFWSKNIFLDAILLYFVILFVR